MICPRCRRLIGREERTCPHCGLSAPGRLRLWWWAARWIESPEALLRVLIWTNGAFFVLALVLSAGRVHLSANPLTFLAPDNWSLLRLGASGTLPIDRLGRWWTLISAGYLHGGLLHLFFNLAALNQIGRLILREYGVHRMLAIYTGGAAAGFWASYLAGVVLTIGASAGLCALVGAALYYGRRRGGVYGQAVYRQTSGWIVGLILIGLMPGINNWAHGGGLAAGAALAHGLGYLERRAESRFDRWLGPAVILLTVLVLGWALVNAFFLRPV
jgi:rhomboid protease GluP